MSETVHSLLQQLDLSTDFSQAVETPFKFKAPQAFVSRIEKGNPDDPLLKQILPTEHELQEHPDFKLDPVGDLAKNPLPSLIHKYQGRVLLLASPRCDIHCRYCFRRHFPYNEQINRRHWQQALEYIQQDASIHEVILSGGDPFSLSENSLLELIKQIESIQHVTTLRIHSRTPIVAPDKAPQQALLEWAETSRLNRVLVVHCNHAQELSDQTHALLKQYRAADFQLLNQSVLLKGVNDNSESLAALSHKLLQQGVLPYYLHQLDKVQGAQHFAVSDETAQALLEQLREQLPGYLVPKLVVEIAGQPSKTPL